MTQEVLFQKFANYFSTMPVLSAYLFGSYAKNKAKKNSDIDILIELDSSAKIGLVGFINMKLDLEKISGKKIDLVDTKGMSKYIKPLVDTEKKLIYDRHKR